jgi:hypothetical protein
MSLFNVMSAPSIGLLVKRSTTFPKVNPKACPGIHRKKGTKKITWTLKKDFRKIGISHL